MCDAFGYGILVASGSFWELFWRVWGLLGRLLGPRGALGETLECSLGAHGELLGTSWGPLGTLWVPLRDPLGALGDGLGALGTILGAPGALLGAQRGSQRPPRGLQEGSERLPRRPKRCSWYLL